MMTGTEEVQVWMREQRRVLKAGHRPEKFVVSPELYANLCFYHNAVLQSNRMLLPAVEGDEEITFHGIPIEVVR